MSPLLTAFLGATLLLGCGQETLPPDGTTQAQIPSQIIEQMEMRQTSTRGLLWILEAETALSYGEGEPTELIGMKVRFYDGEDVVQSILTAKQGQVDPKAESLAAQDSVRVVTIEGDRLETEYLEWNPKKGRVQTPQAFRLLSGGDVITGIGIEADPDLREYAVYSELKAVVKDLPVEEESNPGEDDTDDDH